MARNLLFLAGVMLMLTRWLATGLLWVPVLFLPIPMWLFGTRQLSQVEPWAPLLRPSEDLVAMTIGVLSFVAGCMAYLWPPRSSRWQLPR